MQDLVQGFPVSLSPSASRTPALEGYALPTAIATWQFRRVTVSTNILTSKAPDSWQAQVAQALLPVRVLRLPLVWWLARSTHKTTQPRLAVLLAAFAAGFRYYRMD